MLILYTFSTGDTSSSSGKLVIVEGGDSLTSFVKEDSHQAAAVASGEIPRPMSVLVEGKNSSSKYTFP